MFDPPIQNPKSKIQNAPPGVPQMAIWACLGSKCSQVRILLPGPFPFWILDFGFWIGGDHVEICVSISDNPKSKIQNTPARVAQPAEALVLETS